MNKTYTVAYAEDVVWACVPDGEDIEAAICNVEKELGCKIDRDMVRIADGLLLVDGVENLEDDGKIVFKAGHHTGSLIDENGEAFKYAIRRD